MELSDAEWIVMNSVWELEPTEASEVIQQVQRHKHWSEATVKTMLHRLVKKGALGTEAIGKRYRYRSLVTRLECVRQASRNFLELVFGGHAAPALMHLAASARLTSEEAASLRKLLDKKFPKTRKSDDDQ